jgi:hypothetical protein
MVRAIQRISEADKEWRAWKEELARRHILEEKRKELEQWKFFLKTGVLVDNDGNRPKNTQSPKGWK